MPVKYLGPQYIQSQIISQLLKKQFAMDQLTISSTYVMFPANEVQCRLGTIELKNLKGNFQ